MVDNVLSPAGGLPMLLSTNIKKKLQGEHNPLKPGKPGYDRARIDGEARDLLIRETGTPIPLKWWLIAKGV